MCDTAGMRTTINIEEDILCAAKDISLREGVTLGKALSELARLGLEKRGGTVKKRDGIPVFPKKSDKVVTMEFINQLRDEVS